MVVSFTEIPCGCHPAVARNLEFLVRGTVHRVDPVILVFHSVTPVKILATSTFGRLAVTAVWKVAVDTPRRMDYSTDRPDILS